MSGLGAWYTYYQKGSGALPTLTQPTLEQQLVASACLSIKNELVYRGYAASVTGPKIGRRAEASIKQFQSEHTVRLSDGTEAQLTADGVVGPLTAQALYRARFVLVSRKSGFPVPDIIGKIVSHESLFDPGAQGYVDPDDFGLGQINFVFHPMTTHDQAASGDFTAAFISRELSSAYGVLKDFDAAIAAYNVGTFPAQQWLDAGKPSDTVAGQYVAAVKARVV